VGEQLSLLYRSWYCLFFRTCDGTNKNWQVSFKHILN